MTNTPSDRKRIEALFLAALELPPEAREHFLDGACWGEGAMREVIESLLVHSEGDDGFLEQAALGSEFDLGEFLDDEASKLTPELDSGVSEREGRASPLARGGRLGGYDILGELGHGGQGYVYRAFDRQLGREVAIKVLPEVSRFSARARQRFAREASAASKIDHPGICTIYEVGEEDAVPYIAMQLVEGETLQQKISKARGSVRRGDTTRWIKIASSKPVSTDTDEDQVSSRVSSIGDLVHFAEEMALALHAAHAAGLVHRDVKPANVMVTEKGLPVFLDFGLVRDDIDDGARLTGTGSMMGTPAYMSPEQVAPRGSGESPDRRTDIYSLGVTLFEALTLERPFANESGPGLYTAKLTREAPDPRRANPAIPRDLAVVVQKMLARDPEGRYGTALEVAQDLERIRHFQPILARPPRWTYRVSRFYSRNRNVCTAATLGIVAWALVGYFYWIGPWIDRYEAQARDEAALEEIVSDKLELERRANELHSDARALILADSEGALAKLNELAHSDFRTRERRLPDLSSVSNVERFEAQGKYPEAFEHYDFGLAGAALLKAELYAKSSDPEERTHGRVTAGSEGYNYATRGDPDINEEEALAALIHQGQALYDLGRFSNSETTFQRALETLHPAGRSAPTYIGLGRAREALGEYESAAGAFEIARGLTEDKALLDQTRFPGSAYKALLPPRKYGVLGKPLGLGDLDGDDRDELLCFEPNKRLLVYDLCDEEGRALPKADLLASVDWSSDGSRAAANNLVAVIADVCGGPGAEIVLAWANPADHTGRLSVFECTASSGMREIAWIALKSQVRKMRVLDVNEDGEKEIWLGKGYYGRELCAYRVVDRDGDSLEATELDEFFREPFSSDVDDFLFGDFNPDRPGLELLLTLGPWRQNRLALANVDLDPLRLRIVSVSELQLCAQQSSLYHYPGEPGAFLVLHAPSPAGVAYHKLEHAELLDQGLLLGRVEEGRLAEFSPVLSHTPMINGREEVIFQPTTILEANFRGLGDCLLWLEKGPRQPRLRLARRTAPGEVLPAAMLFGDLCVGAPFVGDLNGDGSDDLLFVTEGLPEQLPPILVLGLGGAPAFSALRPAPPIVEGLPPWNSNAWPRELLSFGCFKEAIEAYREQLPQASPAEQRRILRGIGDCQEELGDVDEAAQTYVEAAAVRTGTDAVDLLLAQARLRLELAEWDAADEVLKDLRLTSRKDDQEEERKRLRARVDDAKRVAELPSRDLLRSGSPVLVENPLACPRNSEGLTMIGESTNTPRFAIPIEVDQGSFQVSVELTPLVADWQTAFCSSILDRDSGMQLGTKEVSDGGELFSLFLRSDGATNAPNRKIEHRAKPLRSRPLPTCMDSGGTYRFDLAEPLRVTMTFYLQSRELRVEARDEAEDVVWIKRLDVPAGKAWPERLWIVFGLGQDKSRPVGSRTKVLISALEIRGARAEALDLEQASAWENVFLGNAHFSAGRYDEAIALYDLALDSPDVQEEEEEDDEWRLRGSALLWRGLARERTEVGSGVEDLTASLQAAPIACLHQLQIAWPRLEQEERTSIRLAFESFGGAWGMKGPAGWPLFARAPHILARRLLDDFGPEMLAALFTSVEGIRRDLVLEIRKRDLERALNVAGCAAVTETTLARCNSLDIDRENEIRSRIIRCLLTCRKDGHDHQGRADAILNAPIEASAQGEAELERRAEFEFQLASYALRRGDLAAADEILAALLETLSAAPEKSEVLSEASILRCRIAQGDLDSTADSE